MKSSRELHFRREASVSLCEVRSPQAPGGAHLLKRPLGTQPTQGTAVGRLAPHMGAGVYVCRDLKDTALLKSLSLLFFSHPEGVMCYVASRSPCPCRFPPAAVAQKWFSDRVSRWVKGPERGEWCGLVNPLPFHPCSPHAGLWIFRALDKICLKTRCGYLKQFLFRGGDFENHLWTKNAGFYLYFFPISVFGSVT